MASSRHQILPPELQDITEEYARLQADIDAMNRYLDELDSPTLVPQLEDTRNTVSSTDTAARVKRLVEAYSDLKREQDEVVRRYAADRVRWSRFKQWLFGRPAKKGGSVSPRRVKGKENAVDDDFEDDPNEVTMVEPEEVLFGDWPRTPKKQPLTPSRLDANSPSSPSTSAILMNSALKAAAAERKTRRMDATRSPLSKKNEIRKFSTEPRNLKRKAEETTPSKTKGKGRSIQPHTEKSEKSYSLLKTAKSNASFKYEEVVRNKRERKQLHGGDCECCRDYYKAVGPLPPRPQPPLWRTPPSSPAKHRHASSSKLGETPFDSDDDFAGDVAAHKKQISRHRHRWEAPKTPPGYWDISFPDTQEVGEINRRADEIHARKRARTGEGPSSPTVRKRKR